MRNDLFFFNSLSVIQGYKKKQQQQNTEQQQKTTGIAVVATCCKRKSECTQEKYAFLHVSDAAQW